MGAGDDDLSATAGPTWGAAEGGMVVVRYWASARAAAGVASETFEVAGPVSLADVRRRALARHPEGRLEQVLAVCAVLLDDRPVGSRDAGQVEVEPGATVEFLPPFAGG